MSDNKNTASASVGIGWLGFLGVVFVILKLNPGGYLNSPVMDWSWWLVLMPFYIGLVILLAIFVVGAIIVGVSELIGNRKAKKRRAEMLRNRTLGRR